MAEQVVLDLGTGQGGVGGAKLSMTELNSAELCMADRTC